MSMQGRASVAIELGDDERSFLEAQLRKHKAERSLSDRCRIVLRCVEGLTAKRSLLSLATPNTQLANGADVLLSIGLRGFLTSIARAD